MTCGITQIKFLYLFKILVNNKKILIQILDFLFLN